MIRASFHSADEIVVSHHAFVRFRERVADLSDAAIHAALTSPAICCAARFGAPYVRLATGQIVVLDGHSVITVLPRGQSAASLYHGHRRYAADDHTRERRIDAVRAQFAHSAGQS